MRDYRAEAKRLLATKAAVMAFGGDEAAWLAAIMRDVEAETRESIADFVRDYRDEEGLLEIAGEIRKAAYRDPSRT